MIKSNVVSYFLGLVSPVWCIKLRYRKIFKKWPDLKCPKDLNEKIQWLKLYSDTSQWSILADKYKVRDYVKQCGCGDMLNELYGVWDNANDIDFNSLPDSFVLKTNHGCGDVILVKDKSKIDKDKIRLLMQNALKNKYGISTGELHYTKITPCIIAERYLEQEEGLSSSLIDYKFYCFKGNPYIVLVCYDRIIGKSHTEMFYDLETWSPRPQCEFGGIQLMKNLKKIPRPQSYDRMLEVCRNMALEFPFVRMDFYEINGVPYLGEMTFTSSGGFDADLTPEFSLELGNQLQLPTQE